MTRLGQQDIAAIAANMAVYEAELEARVGVNLKALAAAAAGVPLEQLTAGLAGLRLAALPVTAGAGIIPGFAEAVAAVLQHLGSPAWVPEFTDVAGLAAAAAAGADGVFMADDQRFIALCLWRPLVVDNGDATGRGFAAALDLMSGGVQDREVLVVGCGQVGASAAAALLERGARVRLFDLDHERARRLAVELAQAAPGRVRPVDDLRASLRQCSHLLEATPAAGFIRRQDLNPEAWVAAPGVPEGLEPEAIAMLGPRYWHDPLQIGVATMAAQLAAGCRQS